MNNNESFLDRRAFLGASAVTMLAVANEAQAQQSAAQAQPSAAQAADAKKLTRVLAEYIATMLRSEETAIAIERFVDRQLDELLAHRLADTVSNEVFEQVVHFVEERFQRLVTEPGFKATMRDFVNGRLDDLAHSGATLAETFTPETVKFLKERIDQQVPPIVHQLAGIATSQNTRKQIGALIKREVDEYYQQLSLFKKIFISRERIHREVDEPVWRYVSHFGRWFKHSSSGSSAIDK